MFKWTSTSSYKKQLVSTFMDIKICEACINDYDGFQDYLNFIEYNEIRNVLIPRDLQDKIVNGINRLNWEGYYD